jgi:microcin C transport system substrate-binding protein
MIKRLMLTLGLTLIFCESTHSAESESTPQNRLITSHAISMHGDIKYPENFPHFDYASPHAKKGGTLKLSAFAGFDSFHGHISKGQPAYRIDLLHQSLLENSLDEPFTSYGLIAEKMTYPEDRSWIQFTLNPKAVFHDGTPITAEDVKFSFNTLIEQGEPTYRFYYADVDTVEVVSAREIKFTFKTNKNRELALIIGQFPILSKNYWKDKDFTKSSLDIPIGSGPYTVASYETNRQVVYKKIKDHWSENLGVNKGLYNFDKIIEDYYQDENVSLEAFKAGEYDLRRERVSRLWATAYAGPAFSNGKIVKTEFSDDTPQGIQAFYFNLRKPLLQNQALRKAMNYAFDFEWTNNQLFYGAYKRSSSYFTNSDLASSGIPTGRELEILNEYKNQLSADIFTSEYKNPVSDGSGRNRANLRKAKKILDDAGFKVKDGRLKEPLTNQAVELSYLLRDSAFERIVNPFAKNLERLGIKLTVDRVDSAQYINRVRGWDFDLFSTGFPQSSSPGNEQREMWGSLSANVEGSRNYMGIQHPVVDALVERLIVADSREELVATTRALDRVLLHQDYIIPHWHSITHRVAFWDKFNMPKTLPKYDTGFLFSPHTWWLKSPEVKNEKPQ